MLPKVFSSEGGLDTSDINKQNKASLIEGKKWSALFLTCKTTLQVVWSDLQNRSAAKCELTNARMPKMVYDMFLHVKEIHSFLGFPSKKSGTSSQKTGFAPDMRRSPDSETGLPFSRKPGS